MGESRKGIKRKQTIKSGDARKDDTEKERM